MTSAAPTASPPPTTSPPRYALDHHGLDDEFWGRMTAHYDQRENVELSMCLGSWLAFGRLNHVLGLDTMCVLPGH